MKWWPSGLERLFHGKAVHPYATGIGYPLRWTRATLKFCQTVHDRTHPMGTDLVRRTTIFVVTLGRNCCPPSTTTPQTVGNVTGTCFMVSPAEGISYCTDTMTVSGLRACGQQWYNI